MNEPPFTIQKTNSVESRAGIKFLIYGQAGAGKTYMASTAGPSTLLVSLEHGEVSLRHSEVDFVGFRDCKTPDEVMTKFLTVMKWAGSSDYEWIIIDSLSKLGDIVYQRVEGESKDPRQDYHLMQRDMERLVAAFIGLTKHVVLFAQLASVETGEGILFGPDFPGRKLSSKLPREFDEVYCLRTATKEVGEPPVRWLQTVNDGRYLAKSRLGLPIAVKPDLQAILENANFGTTQSE